MKCPACQVNLMMTERMGIEIDYCPDCRGIWLDRGELDKLIERSTTTRPNPSTFQAPANPFSREQAYYGHKKKKGFLGDLFDF